MIGSANYAQALRAIGQALEVLHIEAFNMEREGDDYLVRDRTKGSPREKVPPQGVPDRIVQMVWGSLGTQPSEKNETSRARSSSVALELRYTPEDIDRLEREGQARRRNPNGKPDGHSTSQLLRTVGGYVTQKRARLLGISWQEQSVSIVYETAQGRRELDVLRLDSMYDFWVRMSLGRAETAS